MGQISFPYTIFEKMSNNIRVFTLKILGDFYKYQNLVYNIYEIIYITKKNVAIAHRLLVKIVYDNLISLLKNKIFMIKRLCCVYDGGVSIAKFNQIFINIYLQGLQLIRV